MTARKSILPLIAVALSLTGCHHNRYDYIDVASSELEINCLRDGFQRRPDSVSRVQYMLSQGLKVADILVYAGNDSTGNVSDGRNIPYGYAADTIGTEEMLSGIGVAYGRIVTDTGKNYRALYLSDNAIRMSMPVLLKISDMAEKGALIGGVRPQIPSDREDQDKFDLIVNKIWSNGNVLPGKTIESLLRADGVLQDEKTRTAGLCFEHRHLQHAEIYHVGNPSDRRLRAKLKFRVKGRRPLLFYPGTGEIKDVTYKIKRHKTKVVLYIDPGEEVFVVFGPYAAHHKMRYKH